VLSSVGVEKLKISENQYNFEDRKCLGDPNKSFVGHPDAIYFLRILAKRIFQQPPRLSTVLKATAEKSWNNATITTYFAKTR
jgi:hypothetical protein